jgi:hypothetical protein
MHARTHAPINMRVCWDESMLLRPRRAARAQEQVYLTGEQIEHYCCMVAAQLKIGPLVADRDLISAMMHRLASATNLRAGNLEARGGCKIILPRGDRNGGHALHE